MFYLVTGGAGFIGSNLSEELLKRGNRVRIIDNLSTGKEENLSGFISDVEFMNGDIRDLDAVKKAVIGVDCILHQAALPSVPRSVAEPIESNKTNIDGTLNVLIAARDEGVKRVVMASSSSVYGNSETLPKTETMVPNPLSPYAITKYTGERYAKVFYDIYGLETVALRYFNIFGPKQDPNSQYSAAIPKFIKSIISDESPVIYGDGEQSRDFTYVDNAVEANILAAVSEKVGHGETINIACGETTTLNQLVNMINTALGKEVKSVYKEARKGDVRNSLADIHLAQSLLGYKVKVNMEEGLRKLLKNIKG
ncbi:MAG: SDR family oxidoreductase [Deltaproteobacteria bacterium]